MIPPDSGFPDGSYGTGSTVLDTNGNLEAPLNGGTTSSTQPNWPLASGAQTVDGSQIWINVGAVDVATLQVLGGTNGIVVDNTVLPGALAGASQIYLSPLVTGIAICGSADGCAVQASQAGLS